jgi:hypothetical protein
MQKQKDVQKEGRTTVGNAKATCRLKIGKARPNK